MRGLRPFILTIPVLLGGAACGGDAEASPFCETAEEIADGERLEGDDAFDAIEDLADEADDGDLDDVDVLLDLGDAIADDDAEAVADIDQDDVDDAVDELNDLAEQECDVDLALDVEVPEVEAPAEEEPAAEEPEEQAGGEFDDLVAACEGGDMAACDELFFTTPVGSVEEEIGQTCGGLVPADEPIPGQCEATFGDDGDGAAGNGSGSELALGEFGAVVTGEGFEDGDLAGSAACFGEESAAGNAQVSNFEVFLEDVDDAVVLDIFLQNGGPPPFDGQGFLDVDGDAIGLGPAVVDVDGDFTIGGVISFSFTTSIELDDGGVLEVNGSGACTID